MTEKEYILRHMWRHKCTDTSCSARQQKQHAKTPVLWEIPTEIFLNACLMTCEKNGDDPLKGEGIAPT